MENSLWALCAAAAAFIISAILGKVLIPFLHKLKFGQTILEIGPDWHKKKQGTPTMGGIMFIVAIVLSTVAFYLAKILTSQADAEFNLQQLKIIMGLVMALCYGIIGFIDDYIKVVKKRNLGLTAKQKLLMQFLVAAAYLVAMRLADNSLTTTIIPFVGGVDLGWFYYIIAAIVIVGIVNAANLTDGIDGLDGSITFFAAIIMMLMSTMLKNVGGVIESAALAGGCLGFLVWNFHPAKVFMGDTGSLFLGGMVCSIMFALNVPVLLILIGFVYLMEMFSVMLQVTYFKLTHGKRLFKMSPIHHHFEMCGWSEVKIVCVFSILTVIFGGIAVALTYFGVVKLV